MKKLILPVIALAFFGSAASADISYDVIKVYTTASGDGYFHNEVDFPNDFFESGGTSVSAYYCFYGTSNTMQYNTGYAQFSLSGIDASKFISARLCVYLDGAAGKGTADDAGSISHVSNSGSANGNASQKIGGDQAVVTIADGDSGWICTDITSYIQADLTNSYSYSCFSFDPNRGGDYNNHSAGFSVTSYEGGANKLYLELTVVPEPATTAGLIGLGVLPLLLLRRRKAK
jgi:hypothetical protein